MDHPFQPSKLDGPFQWHVYINGADADMPLLDKLAKSLDKYGIFYCFKPSMEQNSYDTMTVRIKQSLKCLLYISENYVHGDDKHTSEIQQLISKANRFSSDVLILLVEGSVKVPAGLESFDTRIEFNEQLLDDNFANSLAEEIGKEPSPEKAILLKENIGYFGASGYFYGFLRLVLPDFIQKLNDALREDLLMQRNSVFKMLIIMPESCFCAIHMESPGLIEHTKKFSVVAANRAGNKLRDYKSSLYKIFDPDRSEWYYFVGEFATPLLTMFEMYSSDLTGMTQDQLYMERDSFFFHLKSIFSHPKLQDCFKNKVSLLYWKDPPAKCDEISEYLEMENPVTGSHTKKTYVEDLHKFLLPVIREEIAMKQLSIVNTSVKPVEQPELVYDRSEDVTPALREIEKGKPDDNRTFQLDQTRGLSHPGPIYDSMYFDRYVMDKDVRGKCVIINMIKFDEELDHLGERLGADVDSANLTNLFTRLKFKVEPHRDLKADALKKLLVTLKEFDHSEYNAFVCCILSHGKLGAIYTSDGEEVNILSITNCFTDDHCPTLKGKPKLFFIQACQNVDDTENEQQNRGQQELQQRQGQEEEQQGQQQGQRQGQQQGEGQELQQGQEQQGQVQQHGQEHGEPQEQVEGQQRQEQQQGQEEQHQQQRNQESQTTIVSQVSVELYNVHSETSCDNPNNAEENLQGVHREAGATSGLSHSSTSSTMIDADVVDNTKLNYKFRLIPGHPDFLMSFSTLPENVSLRDSTTGSFYVQALTEKLGKGFDIKQELEMVTESVEKKLAQSNITTRQLAFSFTTGMTKSIYL